MDDYIAALHDASVDISGDSLGYSAQSVAGGSESSMTGPSSVHRKMSTTKVKQPNFSAVEDGVLCKSWLEISCDPAVNTGQRKKAFWTRVCQRYNSYCSNSKYGKYPERTQKSIESRWDHIKAEISKFSGYMADVVRTNQSGMTNADYSEAAAANFAAIENHSFTLLHCWKILKNEPKWMDLKRKMDNPQSSASRDNDLSSEQHNFMDLDPDDASPARKRPMGRDAAKEAKKKAASDSSAYASKMHELSVEKIELFKGTEVERKARLEKMLALEKVKAHETREHRQMMLEIEKKRLAIEEKRLQMEAEKKEREAQKKEKEEDERILAIDLDKCQPRERIYYEAQQQHIILKWQSRRGPSQ